MKINGSFQTITLLELKQKIALGAFLLLSLCGTLFLLIAWNAWSDTTQIVGKGIKTQGVVLENVHQPTKGLQKQSTALAPVVQFVDANGQLRQYYSQTYTTPAIYKPGDRVELWYLPDDPVQATMDGVDAWILPLVFGIFGTAMSLIGYIGLIGFVRKRATGSAE